VQRQLAAVPIVDVAFPLSTVEAEVEIPADPESMSWADMLSVARLLGSEVTGVVEGERLDAGEPSPREALGRRGLVAGHFASSRGMPAGYGLVTVRR
jgi:hypothetical protein